MKAQKLGILSALTASVCCLGPVLLVLLGLGGLGLGAVLGRYHWYFLLVAVALLTVAWRAYIKERRRCNTAGCQMAQGNVTTWTLLLASAVVAGFMGMNLITYASQQWGSAAHPVQRLVAQTTQVTLPVEGMTCFTCQLTVESSVKKLPGVLEAHANVTQQSATITYDPSQVTIRQLIEAINKTGYRASLPTAVKTQR